MKLCVKLFGIALLLACLILAGFIIWGAQVEMLAADYQTYMEGAKRWAWIGAIGLLISDLVLPVPGTVLLTGLGAVYGTVIGGLVGLTGYFLSALLAYVLAKQCGKDLVLKIASEDEIQQAHDSFNRWGGLVFETEDPQINWDGKITGTNKLVSTGVYYYICDVYENRLSGLETTTLTGFIHVYSGEENEPNIETK